MDVSTAVSEINATQAGPTERDLDTCVHCGLCLSSCPTYRELGLEMDSPRGRIQQMLRVHEGAPVTDTYREHIDLCLACRACESACPSGVPYGRMVEAARAQLEPTAKRGWLTRKFRDFVFRRLLRSPMLLTTAGTFLYIYQATGLQRLLRATGLIRLLGPLAKAEALSPQAEIPFFFRNLGRTFAAEGETRYRVVFLSGCIASVGFARLNEATVRVLQKNGCDVVIPPNQTCCGALHVHSGRREEAAALAKENIDALREIEYDAIITNAAGCGSTLKEYDELLEHDAAYAEGAKHFAGHVADVTEFLAHIGLRGGMSRINATVTYQDSCHLAHGQKVRSAPRELLRAIPGVEFREMPMADTCCGSAGIYNLVHSDIAASILEKKMDAVNSTKAGIVATANPGCLLQLRAGVRRLGNQQRVLHVIELIDEAYKGKS